jgi:hypothetical protein
VEAQLQLFKYEGWKNIFNFLYCVIWSIMYIYFTSSTHLFVLAYYTTSFTFIICLFFHVLTLLQALTFLFKYDFIFRRIQNIQVLTKFFNFWSVFNCFLKATYIFKLHKQIFFQRIKKIFKDGNLPHNILGNEFNGWLRVITSIFLWQQTRWKEQKAIEVNIEWIKNYCKHCLCLFM